MTLLVRDDEEGRGVRYTTSARKTRCNPRSRSTCPATAAHDQLGRRERGRLVWLDCAGGAATVVAEDPTYDVAGARLHPDTHEPQLVFFLKERLDYLVLDPASPTTSPGSARSSPAIWASRDATAQTASGSSRTRTTTARSATTPTTASTARRRSFRAPAALWSSTLAPMEPFAFSARDGLTLHGYLTLPPGAARRACRWSCTSTAARGRATPGASTRRRSGSPTAATLCLQVNFRGSTGYGKEFLNAGDREWGGKMHDDLIDAVDWAVERGLADPERVAIFGGSYGGYAALVGATFTPDVFRCAVDIVGPSNLKTLIKSIPPYWEPMRGAVPRPRRQSGRPKPSFSEVALAAVPGRPDHPIPLLIAQGANDPRVKQAESEQIVEAIARQGHRSRYILFPDEGHGFARPRTGCASTPPPSASSPSTSGGRFEA